MKSPRVSDVFLGFNLISIAVCDFIIFWNLVVYEYDRLLYY